MLSQRKFEPKFRKVSCFLYSCSSYRNQSVDMLSKVNSKCCKHFDNRGVINHGNILEYILHLNDIIEVYIVCVCKFRFNLGTFILNAQVWNSVRKSSEKKEKIALKNPRKFSGKKSELGSLFSILVCYFPKRRPPPRMIS